MSGYLALQEHPTFRTGIVQAQDPATARVRVRFPDRDDVVSWWLPVIIPKSQGDKVYWLPDVGEQVVVLMDEHDEYGAVVGAIFSEIDAPPSGMTEDKFHVTFRDGTAVEYDRAAHALTAVGGSGATILLQDGAGSNVELTADGNVHINGNLFVHGAVWATGDVIASTSGNTISVTTHVHGQLPDSHGDAEQPTEAPTASA